MATHRIVQRGVGYVPEDRDVFSALTVDENLRLAERGGAARYDPCYDLFPELASEASSPPERCPGVSSRWSRSAARS